MTKSPEHAQFIKDKEITEDNLEAIQLNLENCIDDGMIDPDAHFHNEILDLIDEVNQAETYPELQAVIEAAKIVETDIDAWLAMHGRNSVSLSWPRTKQ